MNTISILILAFTPAITSDGAWTSSDIRITEEWSLNVLDLIEPAYEHIGTVYGVETEEGYKWHTILVGEQSVLHYEEDNLLNTISYSGDIYRMTFSNNHQFLLAYCYTEQKLLLFDMKNTSVSTLPLFSDGMNLPGFPLIRVTDDGTVLVKHSTYLRLYDSSLNSTLSLDNFHWNGNFVDFSYTGNSFFTSNNERLYAWDMSMNPLWSVELPEYLGSLLGGIGVGTIQVHQTNQIMVITDYNTIYIYSQDNGKQLFQNSYAEHVGYPIFNETGNIITFSTYTDPESTPLKPIFSFGLRSILQTYDSYSEYDLFEIEDFRSQPLLPYMINCQSISNEGYVLGMLFYSAPSIHVRLILLSPETDILWLSNNYINSNRRFIGSCAGFRSDIPGFWYFDGETLHSVVIEGV